MIRQDTAFIQIYKRRQTTKCLRENNNIYILQLSLLLLSQKVRHQQVADLESGFVEVEAHALRAESLGDDVELETKHIKLVMLTHKDNREETHLSSLII